jgi:UDPglucose 6-dehydrogenase
MKITVVGGGYVGLVSAACFADLGHNVTIIEIDPHKVEQINKGIPPIYEDGLAPILKESVGQNLCAQADYHDLQDTDVFFICVGTPPQDDGSADLTYLSQAADSIGKAIRDVKKYQVVTVKSTVPPGTTETVVLPGVLTSSGRTENSIGFCMNPEFLREGLAIEDFKNPDRIVIGGNTAEAIAQVQKVYAGVSAPLITTSIKAAEMIKYASNSFLAMKISFSNEIGNLCKKLGINVYEVMNGVGYDHRINPHFLNAGLGFGGSCFPKDVMALIRLAEKNVENPILLRSVIKVNEGQPEKIVSVLKERIGSLSQKHIAVLGLAFKDNTDDVRDSRSIPVIQALLREKAEISAYDPMATESMKRYFPNLDYKKSAGDALEGADACLVLTEWPEFTSIDKEFDRMKTKVIIEGRRILSLDGIEGVCW